MSRSRLATSISAAILVIALLGACSAESLAEFATERYVESQTDGEVDIDFGSGGFNVSTEEGDFGFNLDGENGALVFDTEDGSGVVNFDAEDGTITYDTDEGSGVVSFDVDENSEQGSITFDSDQGSGVVNFDGEDGTITYDTDEGSGVVSFDVDENSEQGSITFDSDEGSGSFNFGSAEAPANWPAAVGVPSSPTQPPVYSELNDGSDIVLNGTFTHDAGEDFASAVVARLESSGYVNQYTQSGQGTVVAQFSIATAEVFVASYEAGVTNVVVTNR